MKKNNLLLLFLAFTVLAICFTAHAYLNYAVMGRSIPILQILLWELAGWYLWAALFPLILHLARKWPIERDHWITRIPAHIAFSIFFALFHLTLHVGLSLLLDRLILKESYEYFTALSMNFVSRFGWRILLYFIFLVAGIAIDSRHRFQEEERRAEQLAAQLANAKLDALKMQLQPHFLFNTLQTISELMHQDVQRADEMLVRLADFLRITLENAGTQKITLQQEMRFLETYLGIQQIRFQDRLEVKTSIEPQANVARVPNLILQPIVENAIRHGIAPRSAPGLIEVQAGCKNGRLQIRIRDNGKGLSPGQNPSEFFNKGVGLSNAQARLKQIYESNYRLDLANSPAGGLEVTLDLPFES